MNRLIQWPMLCGLLALLLVQTVPAGQDFYINNDVVTDPGNIDATNFINNNSFTVTSFTPYETTHTLNYTNNGEMVGYTGFLFDTLSSGFRSTASSFYNPGSITGYTLQEFGEVGGIFNYASGLLAVNATNIISPGLIDEGLNGLILLQGENLDLSYSTLTMEQGGEGNTFGIIGSGAFGGNTNQNWDPSIELQATMATASTPTAFTIFNSMSYFKTNMIDASNLVIRAVFISNPYPGTVTNKVYFESDQVGSGNAHVEWDGVYTEPATGETFTNYLYLSDDYVLGASTNVMLSGIGIPDNFTFSKGGPDPTLTDPVASSFPNGLFPSGAMTNLFSYFDAQFLPTSVATGPTSDNPSGAYTNLPSRIVISASRDLNLSLATITGENYLSVTATNQFDGNFGAQIVSPYTDLNLGVTNGSITVSNLLQSVIPVWVGSVQGWSTRWYYTDTNSGINYDFRVLIVDSEIFPQTSPQVNNLTLHGTNLVISDALNVIGKLSADAQSLTLTTNGLGVGAGSTEGELNFTSGNTLIANALPNLLWLTNNGAITLYNSANFGSPPPGNYQAFINNGELADSGSTIYANYFENSGFIFNGTGNFLLQSQTTVLTNGFIAANGDISITADSLTASNLEMEAGRSLTLQATNLLTDTGVNNGNNWSVGASSLVGLKLPIKPAAGDLLGTTISEVASASKNVVNTWAGEDRGTSNSGYLNNVAVGRLVLDAVSVPPHSLLTFNGTGASNAIYVDELVLKDNAATLNSTSSNVTSLAISPGMVIYYAQALANEVSMQVTNVVSGGVTNTVTNAVSTAVSVAEQINHWNNNRLRWVPSYVGFYSSTNFTNSDGSVTPVNQALVTSTNIDSNNNGIPNASDPNPFALSDFKLTLTNSPPNTAVISWQFIPNAMNYVYYSTNLATSNWNLLTNFTTTASPPPFTTILDPVSPATSRFYRVQVDPAVP